MSGACPGKIPNSPFLPGNLDLLGILAYQKPIGEISYRMGTTMQHLAVAWGSAEVLPDKVAKMLGRCQESEPKILTSSAREEAKARAGGGLCDRPLRIWTLRRRSLRCGAEPKFAWLSRPARNRPPPRTNNTS